MPPPPREAPSLSDREAQRAAFRIVFPGVMFSMMLAAIDQTILAAALPAIAGALGNFADVSWLASAYLIAATISAPIYGHLGDRFGRRRILFVALGLFVLASIACTLSTSLSMLIVARTVQGLGGGGLMTTSHALIGEHIPARERGRYQGYFAAVFAASSTLGPMLGGYLTQHASWRAVFVINVPLGILAAWLAWRLPQSPGHREGRFRPDIVGILLFALAACVLLFALSSAGNRIAWSSPLLLALLAIAVFAFVALVVWERRASDPVIPVALLAKASILRANLMVMTFAASLFALVLYLPTFFQLARGAGVGESGMLLLPVTLTLALTGSVTGHLITRTGWLTIMPMIGLSASTVVFGFLALTLPWLPTGVVLVLIALGAAGLGTVMSTSQVLVQDEAERAMLGAATASLSVSRSFGGALGAALAGALLYLWLGGRDAAFSDALAKFGEHGAQFLDSLSAGQREALATQMTNAFQAVFTMLALFTAIGTVLAYSVPRRRI